jgi:hypothetical protein
LEFRGAPAVAKGGDVYLPARASSSGGVFHVTPSGVATQDNSAGPVEAGLAVGDDASAQHIFFMTTNGGVQSVGDTMHSCGSASSTNLSSLAILNDGTSAMYAVGVAGDTGSRQLVGLQQGFGCKPSLSVSIDVATPGNIIIDGQNLWYPGSDGSVQRFTFNAGSTSFVANSPLAAAGAGTIFGLSLFSAGAKLAGGTGAVGAGRVFVRASDGTGTTTGSMPNTPVSGIAIGSGPTLFAVVTQASGVGTLRSFDATGDTVGATMTLPAGFSFTFPAGATPGATTPVLGRGGFLYATANNGNVVAADQQSLDVSWLKPLPAAIATSTQVLASPTLDCNRTDPSSATGAYYFATTTGWLVAYIVDSPGLDSAAAWPKYQHDARNTGSTGTAIECP